MKGGYVLAEEKKQVKKNILDKLKQQFRLVARSNKASRKNLQSINDESIRNIEKASRRSSRRASRRASRRVSRRASRRASRRLRNSRVASYNLNKKRVVKSRTRRRIDNNNY